MKMGTVEHIVPLVLFFSKAGYKEMKLNCKLFRTSKLVILYFSFYSSNLNGHCLKDIAKSGDYILQF